MDGQVSGFGTVLEDFLGLVVDIDGKACTPGAHRPILPHQRTGDGNDRLRGFGVNRPDRGRTACASFGKRNRQRIAILELSYNQQEAKLPRRTKASPVQPSTKTLSTDPILATRVSTARLGQEFSLRLTLRLLQA